MIMDICLIQHMLALNLPPQLSCAPVVFCYTQYSKHGHLRLPLSMHAYVCVGVFTTTYIIELPFFILVY